MVSERDRNYGCDVIIYARPKGKGKFKPLGGGDLVDKLIYADHYPPGSEDRVLKMISDLDRINPGYDWDMRHSNGSIFPKSEWLYGVAKPRKRGISRHRPVQSQNARSYETLDWKKSMLSDRWTYGTMEIVRMEDPNYGDFYRLTGQDVRMDYPTFQTASDAAQAILEGKSGVKRHCSLSDEKVEYDPWVFYTEFTGENTEELCPNCR